MTGVCVFIIAGLIFATAKKVNVYDSFVDGAKSSLKLTANIFPYLVATFLMVNLLQASGVDKLLVQLVSPLLGTLGIPKELVQLTLLRPFSGSGSLALLGEIYGQYGADSYVSRCASVIMGSSETVFYLSAVYFSATKVKQIGWALPIALFCNFVGCVASCLLCRVL